MNTSVTHKIETAFILNGLVVHTNDLGYAFIEMTLKGLARHHGRGDWTVQTRTVSTTVETTDWQELPR